MSISHNPFWESLSDSTLFHIFSYLPSSTLLKASQCCKQWNRVAFDDFLWRDKVRHTYEVPSDKLHLPFNANSWYDEFKRLDFHTPCHESEVLDHHTDEVLHVAFSHNGQYFVTSSKDGTFIVWQLGYPTRMKHFVDMAQFGWGHIMFAEFNQSDSLLLVCGVRGGSMWDGQSAVFHLTDKDCTCLHHMRNVPYDNFGAWYSDFQFFTGLKTLHSAHATVTLNEVQMIEGQRDPKMMFVKLLRFLNHVQDSPIIGMRCVQKVKVEDFEEDTDAVIKHRKQRSSIPEAKESHVESYSDALTAANCACGDADTSDVFYSNPSQNRRLNSETGLLEYDPPCNVLDLSEPPSSINHESGSFGVKSETNKRMPLSDNDPKVDRYFMFWSGTRVNAPTDLAVKRLDYEKVSHRMNEFRHYRMMQDGNIDEIDHMFSFNGRIIGSSPSPDHRYESETKFFAGNATSTEGFNVERRSPFEKKRYMYVNVRKWPSGFQIVDDDSPPLIKQDIEMHVIDLVTMRDLGVMHRGHVGFTPDNSCFLIYIDVCDQYVTSGSEDHFAYVWDRHYGSLLRKLPHTDVVSAAAFNPRDPDVMVTASDDNTVKVWRSKRRCKELGITTDCDVRSGMC